MTGGHRFAFCSLLTPQLEKVSSPFKTGRKLGIRLNVVRYAIRIIFGQGVVGGKVKAQLGSKALRYGPREWMIASM